MKFFKKIINTFKKYKNVAQDIDDIKDRFDIVINDIYTNLGEAKWDIVALKSKVRDLEKGQE